MDPNEIENTIARVTRTITGLAGARLVSTLKPPTFAQPDEIEIAIRELADVNARPIAARFMRQELLGEGGMGIVFLATQRSLARHVAIKELREELQGEVHTHQLLREAWVTGSLEHPNIAPVYEIGLDDRGSPFVVLKRIEGVHWGHLMRDEAALRERLGATDLLEWNLSVLIDVSKALELAHSRAIIHRDVKPENVMIGSAGEVYLVDWGIAVTLGGSNDGRFPLVADEQGIAGSLLYMAPEMVDRSYGPLGTWTDVYLMGSVLYEIVAGRPPHGGNSIVEMLSSILSGPPALPADAPEELAHLVTAAMATDTKVRPTAAAFRDALRAFLRHRPSMALTREAQTRLDEIESLGSGSAPELDRYRLFGACRFGFRAALREWPENERARAGLDKATRLMIEHELEANQPRAARAHLAESDLVDAELERRVERAERQHEEAEALKARAVAAQDLRQGQRARVLLALAFGALWTIVPVLTTLAELTSLHHVTYADTAFGTAAWLVIALLLYFTRLRGEEGTVNRRFINTLVATMIAQLLLQLGGSLLGLPASHAQAIHPLLYGIVLSLIVITMDARLKLAPVGFFIAFLGASRWPHLRGFFTGGANAFMTIVFLFAARTPLARDGVTHER
ncbi:MAG: serine/threonine protein kinase [Polyangiaceae bacterium]|nr:serine/threonine protein kinase [Polyangiaceae bacterium]